MYAAYLVKATRKPMFIGLFDSPDCEFLNNYHANLKQLETFKYIPSGVCIQVCLEEHKEANDKIKIGGILNCIAQFGGY